ncbi:hypothetical protein [Ferribacterium limneticum]|uniref:hypothetical protein n=1 Tax=Ferribacterium limneticum TaxID=76259 RepID=UPI001CF876E0|nr:hypothetical protein [Ferribacterium limneticum]UCV24159.1 hypothetical protein KI613_06465 [Ferribacterium limneticum]
MIERQLNVGSHMYTGQRQGFRQLQPGQTFARAAHFSFGRFLRLTVALADAAKAGRIRFKQSVHLILLRMKLIEGGCAEMQSGT